MPVHMVKSDTKDEKTLEELKRSLGLPKVWENIAQHLQGMMPADAKTIPREI